MPKTLKNSPPAPPAARRQGTGLFLLVVLMTVSFAAGWNLGSQPVPSDQAVVATGAKRLVRRLPEGKYPADPILRRNEETVDNILNSTLSDEARLAHLRKFFAGLDSPSARALYGYFLAKPRSRDDQVLMNARNQLVARVTELDPAGALAWVQEMPDAPDRIDAFQALLDAWGDHDPVPLLAVVESLGRLGAQRELLSAVLGMVAETNPQAAFNYLNNIPASQNRALAYAAIFDHWARLDPRQAAMAAMSLPTGSARKNALSSVASEWAGNDPQSAMSWAAALPEGNLRKDAVANVLQRISESNPTIAIQFLEAMPVSGQRPDLVASLVGNWASHDPAAALAWTQNAGLPPQVLTDTLSRVLSSLAQTDPAGAAAAAAAISSSPIRQESLACVARAWSASDPVAALAWAEGLPATAGDKWQNISETVLETWANDDPAAAAAYLESHPARGDTQVMAVALIAREWTDRDQAGALAWAVKLPEGDAQVSALREILTKQAEDDPDASWALLKQLPLDQQRYQNLQTEVLQAIIGDDPAKSIPYWAQLPVEAQRNSVSQLVSLWTDQNPGEAAQWVDGLPAGEMRDRAVASLVSRQAEFEPAQAFAWAATIGDLSQRRDGMLEAARQLYLVDPTLAEQTIQTANLSGNQIAQLLRDVFTDRTPGDSYADDPVEDEAPPSEQPPAPAGDYTVQAGDTLTSIARRLGVDLEELIQANAVADPRTLQIGQKLTVPGPLAVRTPSAPSSEIHSW